MFLIDEDMRLRAIEPTDQQLLYLLINDPDVERAVVGWTGPVSLASQLDWVSRLRPDDFRYAIDVAQTPRGVAIISPIDFKNRSANIHIKLLESQRGQGLGARAVKLMLDYLFRELDMEIITAAVLEYNLPSRRLFEKCGFVRDGMLRSRIYKAGARHGVIQYSIVRAEYPL